MIAGATAVSATSMAALYAARKRWETASRARKQGAYGKVPILKPESSLSVLSRPRELIAALRFKMQMSSFKKETAASMSNAGKDFAWSMRILNKVSRSFAGVIAQLPQELRKCVCVFYLVLRALDTVEDEMDLSRFERYRHDAVDSKGSDHDREAQLRDVKIRLMTEFGKRLGREDGDDNLKGIGEAHERELLENFDRVARVYLSLPGKYRSVIANITHRMSVGMAKYVGRDLRSGTEHVRDYDRYCEIVAGYVGEGLSELWVASGMENARILQDREAIYAMGLFLQKTNIIRDYLEDLTEGRTFWPREIWSLYANDLKELRNQDPCGQCVDHMVADAMRLLPACIRYLRMLKTESIFRFCAIPQIMAIATLSHVQKHNRLVYRGVLKIQKTKAAWLIMDVAQSARRTETYMRREALKIFKRLKVGNAQRRVVSSLIRTSESSIRRTQGLDSDEDEVCSKTTALSLGSVATAAVLGYSLRHVLTSGGGLVKFDAGTLALCVVSMVYLYVALFTSRSQNGRLVFSGDDGFEGDKDGHQSEKERSLSNDDVADRRGTTQASPCYVVQERAPPSPIEDDERSNDLSKDFFVRVFDELRDTVVKDLVANHELGDEAESWIRKMCNYNVLGGKMNRGLTVIHSLRALRGRRLTKRELHDAACLGWCIEWLQAFFLVADDVMDRSVTRRGRPCWYKLDGVKEIAVNDAFILESCVFRLLRLRFRGRNMYVPLMELFHDVTLQTEIGQLLDLTSQPIDGEPDLTRFTARRHAMIVKYKTAFYSFYLPIACSMILSDITNDDAFVKAKEICCIMGEYFQVQDDYLDCYGDPKVIGKIGTDIQDSKCSWLVVQALRRANASQRKVLIDAYGKDEDECVKRVKELYGELRLQRVYEEYERRSYERICGLIDECGEVPSPVFRGLLKKIYKRSK